MKGKFINLAFTSLVLGVIFTLFIQGPTNWNTQGDCSYKEEPRSSNIERIDCSSLETGFPIKYISSESRLSQTFKTPDLTAPVALAVSSKPSIDEIMFIANVVIWSVLSAVVLSVIPARPFYKRIARKNKS